MDEFNALECAARLLVAVQKPRFDHTGAADAVQSADVLFRGFGRGTLKPIARTFIQRPLKGFAATRLPSAPAAPS